MTAMKIHSKNKEKGAWSLVRLVKKMKKNRNTSLQKTDSLFSAGQETVILDFIKNGEREAFLFDHLKQALILLQLSNDEEVFAKVSLEEIEEVYRMLCKYQRDDLDLNLEYYSFLYNVMDKEEEATKFLEKYRKYVNKKINSYILRE